MCCINFYSLCYSKEFHLFCFNSWMWAWIIHCSSLWYYSDSDYCFCYIKRFPSHTLFLELDISVVLPWVPPTITHSRSKNQLVLAFMSDVFLISQICLQRNVKGVHILWGELERITAAAFPKEENCSGYIYWKRANFSLANSFYFMHVFLTFGSWAKY